MATLTLKNVPDDLHRRLKERARTNHRSLNREAIRVLESGLADERPSFSEAYDQFLATHGPSPLDNESFEEIFGGLRDQDTGRPSPFEDES